MKKSKIITVSLGALLTLAPLVYTSAVAKEVKKGSFEFKCVDPRPSGKDATEVIGVLKGMLQALAECDYETFSASLDENAYMFDSRHKDTVRGKDEIVKRIKQNLVEEEHDKTPLLSFTIIEPYAIAKEDVAVVTYSAVECFGGDKPHSMESRCSNVFIKKDNKWLMVQHRGDWKPVSDKTKCHKPKEEKK